MRLLSMILFLALASFTPAEAEAARRKLTVEEQYEIGLKYMRRSYYVKALEQFNRIRNYHRDDPYAVKAELAIADVYFKKADWDQARLAYEDFMRMHPRHKDLDYVVWRIGMSLYKKAPRLSGRDQTWTRQAVNTWSGYAGRFPESAYAEEAEGKLQECRERLARKELHVARFYQRRKAWSAVEGRTSSMLERFPKSDERPWALGMLAQAHKWQGEDTEASAALDSLRAEDARAADKLAPKLARIVPKED